MDTKKTFYEELLVPLPSKPLVIGDADTQDVVCQKLDDFFDDLIRDYAPNTQKILREMYHEYFWIYPVKPTSLDEGMLATWYMTVDDGNASFRMKVNEDMVDCPVTFRWLKIHEIAAHIGQAAERVSQVGIDKAVKEFNDEDLNGFLEQSVTLAEKMIIDAIPMRIFDMDIDCIQNPSSRDFLRLAVKQLKDTSLQDYTRLKHRPDEDRVNEEGHARFFQRADVAAFISGYPALTQVDSIPEQHVISVKAASPKVFKPR